jgi:hypothetical protein
MTENDLLLSLQTYLNRKYPERGDATLTGMSSLNTGWESDVYRFSVQWSDPMRFPPEQLGMRPGAQVEMLKHAPRLRIIHTLLCSYTGIQIPEVEQFLESSGA